MKLYPLADWPTIEERAKFGLKREDSFGNIRAVSTGQKRNPKRSEWFLSGAIVEAYRAPNDLSTPYHIARLVNTKTTVTAFTEIIA